MRAFCSWRTHDPELTEAVLKDYDKSGSYEFSEVLGQCGRERSRLSIGHYAVVYFYDRNEFVAAPEEFVAAVPGSGTGYCIVATGGALPAVTVTSAVVVAVED